MAVVGSYGGGVSYERGTPVQLLLLHAGGLRAQRIWVPIFSYGRGTPVAYGRGIGVDPC